MQLSSCIWYTDTRIPQTFFLELLKKGIFQAIPSLSAISKFLLDKKLKYFVIKSRVVVS